MKKKNISTLSKKFKSPEWKERKRIKHAENLALRSELHKEKRWAGGGGALASNARALVQQRIDAISNNT